LSRVIDKERGWFGPFPAVVIPVLCMLLILFGGVIIRTQVSFRLMRIRRKEKNENYINVF
jgi:hypothetical protein